MPTELGLPRYHKYSETEPGTRLVHMGEFIGSTEGKFGAQHNFIELATGQQVVLNKSGGLDWNIEKGRIKEGGVYDIYFEGKEKLTKGTFAGKDANRFKIAVYSPEELSAAGLKRSGASAGAKPTSAPAAAVASVPQPTVLSDSLDDLD